MLNSIIDHVSQLNEKQLSKLMKKLEKKFPIQTKEEKKTGFDTPIYIRDELANFLKEAYENETERQERLTPLLSLNILSRSVLTRLMIDYIVRNRFVETIQDKSGKPKENVFYKADDLMNKYLSSALDKLEEMDSKKTDKEMTDLRGNIKLRFNRNKFTYVRLQSIVNFYVVPSSERTVPATPEIMEFLNNLKDFICVPTNSLPPCRSFKVPENIRNMPSPPGSPTLSVPSLPCISLPYTI